jgi:hypothetical protein
LADAQRREMTWRILPALGVMGGVFVTNFSVRVCSAPPIFSSELGEEGGLAAGGPCSTPGATQTCNTYGNQTCTSSEEWGPCTCPAAPVCGPGASQGCGNCGIETCNACGQWGEEGSTPACRNQGVCTPGETGPEGCYEGEDAFCNPSCEWVCP